MGGLSADRLGVIKESKGLPDILPDSSCCSSWRSVKREAFLPQRKSKQIRKACATEETFLVRDTGQLQSPTCGLPQSRSFPFLFMVFFSYQFITPLNLYFCSWDFNPFFVYLLISVLILISYSLSLFTKEYIYFLLQIISSMSICKSHWDRRKLEISSW